MKEKNSQNRLLKLIYIFIPIFIITILLKVLNVQITLYSLNPSTFILWLFSTIIFVWGIDEICKSIENSNKN
mgnify:CR=1 FL=1